MTNGLEKYFTVLQPPYSDKFNFLVDTASDYNNIGHTIDIHKVLYNIKLIGEEFDIDISINNLLSDKGTTAVFPLGTYIVILKLNKDETFGEMLFMGYDFTIPESEMRALLTQQFSNNIVNSWMNCFETMRENERNIIDNVFLLVED